MRRAGFAVLPANGKSPLVAGFNKWSNAPGLTTVNKWAARSPEADVVYVPSLSGTKRGGDGIIVIDGDDDAACGRIAEIFGDTPGKVLTKRGCHFLYRAVGRSLGALQSLKAYGLNADVKHGRSIVVAPPSCHEKDNAFEYSWDGCDETVIGHLPLFSVAALQSLIDRSNPRPEPVSVLEPRLKISTQCNNTAPPPRQGGLLRSYSRGLELNRYLCKQAWACETYEALLDCAQTFNLSLTDRGLEPLDQSEVDGRTLAVWRDWEAGKLVRWQGSRSVAAIDAEQVKDLVAEPHGGDAVALLMLLRAEHQARIVLRGETFALNVKAMVKAETMPSWTLERYRNAISTLLRKGYLQKAEEAHNSRRGRVAAQFTLRQ